MLKFVCWVFADAYKFPLSVDVFWTHSACHIPPIAICSENGVDVGGIYNLDL